MMDDCERCGRQYQSRARCGCERLSSEQIIKLQQREIERMRNYLTRLGYDWEREIPLRKENI